MDCATMANHLGVLLGYDDMTGLETRSCVHLMKHVEVQLTVHITDLRGAQNERGSKEPATTFQDAVCCCYFWCFISGG